MASFPGQKLPTVPAIDFEGLSVEPAEFPNPPNYDGEVEIATCRELTADQFNAFRLRNPRLKVSYRDGRILLHRYARNQLLLDIQSFCIRALAAHSMLVFGSPHRPLVALVDAMHVVGRNHFKVSDLVICCQEDNHTFLPPTVVIEIELHCSLTYLHGQAHHYLDHRQQNDIEQYVALKIFPPSDPSDLSGFRMIVLRYSRGEQYAIPINIFSMGTLPALRLHRELLCGLTGLSPTSPVFRGYWADGNSDGPCSHVNQLVYQLEFPMPVLCANRRLESPIQSFLPGWVLSLHELQRVVQWTFQSI